MQKINIDNLSQKEIKILQDAILLKIKHYENLILECENLKIDTLILKKKRLHLIRVNAKLKIALDKALGKIPIKKKEV